MFTQTFKNFRALSFAFVMAAVLMAGIMTPVDKVSAQEFSVAQKSVMLQQIDTLMQIIVLLTSQLEAIQDTSEAGSGEEAEGEDMAEGIEDEGGAEEDLSTEVEEDIEEEEVVAENAVIHVDVMDTNAILITNDPEDASDDEGEFTIRFDVTAEEDDVYIKSGVDRATAHRQDYNEKNNYAGFWYSIYNVAEPGSHGGSFSPVVSSVANEAGDRYLIEEGETETFELKVLYDPDQSGEYRVSLHGVVFNDVTQYNEPSWDYRTVEIAIGDENQEEEDDVDTAELEEMINNLMLQMAATDDPVVLADLQRQINEIMTQMAE